MNSVVIASFEQVVNDFNSVITKVNEHYGIKFMHLNDVKEADESVKKDIENRYDRLGQNKMSHIKPVPTKERNHANDKLRDTIMKHDDFMRAKQLYLKIMSSVNN